MKVAVIVLATRDAAVIPEVSLAGRRRGLMRLTKLVMVLMYVLMLMVVVASVGAGPAVCRTVVSCPVCEGVEELKMEVGVRTHRFWREVAVAGRGGGGSGMADWSLTVHQ